MRTFPLACLVMLVALGGCTGLPVQGQTRAAQPASASRPLPAPVAPAVSSRSHSTENPLEEPRLRPVGWSDLPGWEQDDLSEAWPAWLQSCTALRKEFAWQRVCERSFSVDGRNREAVRDFFQQNFQPHEVTGGDASPWGVVTGYYAPTLHGDRVRTDRARYPVYGLPDDLVTVDLSAVYPELKFKRLRGRLVGNRLVPYFTRSEIVQGIEGFRAKPIAWAEDPVELFYLQIEGSGRIEFPDGTHLRVGYAGQNGHPFRSVARILIEQGELKPGEASVQGIRQWGLRNPQRLDELLNHNPSYVFFRELPDGLSGPVGSLGVPLTGGRSAAVDPRFIPMGAPIFLSTTRPLSDRPLNLLMLAQDAGGAIRGPVRVDFYWGMGDEAGAKAGKMKQAGRKWLLLPREGEQ